MFLARSAEEKSSRAPSAASSAPITTPHALPSSFASSKFLPPAPPANSSSVVVDVPIPSVSPPKPSSHERAGRGGGRGGGGGYGRGGRGGARAAGASQNQGDEGEGDEANSKDDASDDDDDWVGLRRKMKSNSSPDGRVHDVPAVSGFWGAYGTAAVGTTSSVRSARDENVSLSPTGGSVVPCVVLCGDVM